MYLCYPEKGMEVSDFSFNYADKTTEYEIINFFLPCSPGAGRLL